MPARAATTASPDFFAAMQAGRPRLDATGYDPLPRQHGKPVRSRLSAVPTFPGGQFTTTMQGRDCRHRPAGRQAARQGLRDLGEATVECRRSGPISASTSGRTSTTIRRPASRTRASTTITFDVIKSEPGGVAPGPGLPAGRTTWRTRSSTTCRQQGRSQGLDTASDHRIQQEWSALETRDTAPTDADGAGT